MLFSELKIYLSLKTFESAGCVSNTLFSLWAIESIDKEIELKDKNSSYKSLPARYLAMPKEPFTKGLSKHTLCCFWSNNWSLVKNSVIELKNSYTSLPMIKIRSYFAKLFHLFPARINEVLKDKEPNLPKAILNLILIKPWIKSRNLVIPL